MKYEGLCHSCKRNNVGMKHPIDAGKYKGGHDSSRSRRRVNFPMGPLDLPKGVDARMKDMEERIRCLFQVCILSLALFLLVMSLLKWFISLGP
jgi:hypothetical protein